MSAPVRSNSVSASVPVAATETSKPSLRSMYDSGVGERLFVLDHQYARHTCCPFVAAGEPHCAAYRGSESTVTIMGCSISTDGGSASAASGGRAGSRRVNVEPTPTVLATSTRPPWLVAMCLTMARPSPVPPVARERARSAR